MCWLPASGRKVLWAWNGWGRGEASWRPSPPARCPTRARSHAPSSSGADNSLRRLPGQTYADFLKKKHLLSYLLSLAIQFDFECWICRNVQELKKIAAPTLDLTRQRVLRVDKAPKPSRRQGVGWVAEGDGHTVQEETRGIASGIRPTELTSRIAGLGLGGKRANWREGGMRVV